MMQRARTIAAGLEASENPSYLDSAGWVFYRSGDFARARTALAKAAALPVQRAPDVPFARPAVRGTTLNPLW